MLGGKYDKTPHGGMQLGCAFAGGITPVSVSFNNQISILPMPSAGGKIEVLTGHNAPIGAVAFDHSKKVFYTGDSDGIICKWDLKQVKALERIIPPNDKEITYQTHKGAVSALTVLEDSRLLSMGWDDTAHYTKNDKLQSEALDITAQPVAASTGTKLSAILTVKGVMLLKNGKQASQGILPLKYTGHCIAVSKDDKTIYIGGDDCKIYVYSSDLSEKHVISDGHLKPVHSLALSNDGTKLAAGDARDVCVYKTSDFSTVIGKSTFCFHLQKVTALAWSQDDKIVASGGADDSIYLWSIEKKKRVTYKYAHRGGVVALAFKTDTPGMTLISAGKDSCIISWDVTNDAKKKFG
jgi:WD40 repeat protein